MQSDERLVRRAQFDTFPSGFDAQAKRTSLEVGLFYSVTPAGRGRAMALRPRRSASASLTA